MSASPENKNISWSKTDHRGETDLSTANPVSASPENKNISWSKTDHRGETDLSTANPASAFLRIRIYPGPRRIIVERRIFHRQPGERLPENKNISWSKTDHRGETDLSTANPVSALP